MYSQSPIHHTTHTDPGAAGRVLVFEETWLGGGAGVDIAQTAGENEDRETGRRDGTRTHVVLPASARRSCPAAAAARGEVRERAGVLELDRQVQWLQNLATCLDAQTARVWVDGSGELGGLAYAYPFWTWSTQSSWSKRGGCKAGREYWALAVLEWPPSLLSSPCSSPPRTARPPPSFEPMRTPPVIKLMCPVWTNAR